MENREQEALRELGSARVGEIHCITIIGQIEGHMMLPPDTKTTKYEHIMPLLAAVEEAEDVRALLILLNTVGGDIEAGLCLAEMIAGMSKPTASVVLGGGHSIGVPLAVAANRSFIVTSAAVTNSSSPSPAKGIRLAPFGKMSKPALLKAETLWKRA